MPLDLKRINPEEAQHFWANHHVIPKHLVYLSRDYYWLPENMQYCGCLLGVLALEHNFPESQHARDIEFDTYHSAVFNALIQHLEDQGFDPCYLKGLDNAFTTRSPDATPPDDWSPQEAEAYRAGIEDGYATERLLHDAGMFSHTI